MVELAQAKSLEEGGYVFPMLIMTLETCRIGCVLLTADPFYKNRSRFFFSLSHNYSTKEVKLQQDAAGISIKGKLIVIYQMESSPNEQRNKEKLLLPTQHHTIPGTKTRKN